MELEGQLIPILRDGVEVVKMIFFKKLKAHLARKYPDPAYSRRLAGAIVNDLFGTPNPEEPFASFVVENRPRIDEEMAGIASNFAEMRIPLTDALRIQFLCDHQEGIDSTSALVRARELHILLVDREVPLPAQFMNLVRRLGEAFGFLAHPPHP